MLKVASHGVEYILITMIHRHVPIVCIIIDRYTIGGFVSAQSTLKLVWSEIYVQGKESLKYINIRSGMWINTVHMLWSSGINFSLSSVDSNVLLSSVDSKVFVFQ